MKKLILAIGVSTGLAAGVAAVTGTAFAADLPRGPQPYYSAPAYAPGSYYNWAGAYAGVNLGYQWGKVSNSNTYPDGFDGGLQGGYNWQSGQFVYGGETDLQVSGADDTFAPFKFSNPWFGTLRGRAGLAMNNILFYGTAGIAYGSVKGESGGASETKTSLGWTVGAGVEFGFTPKWSAKVEYLYADLGSHSYSFTGTDNGFTTNIVRVGVNYHF